MIIIKNNQILQEVWNDNLEIHELKDLDKPLNYFYNESLKFDELLNLEGFFDALSPHFNLLDIDFIAYTRGFTLKEYYDELKTQPNSECNNSEIKCIQFYKCYNMHSYMDLMTGKVEITVDDYVSYHGKNVDPKECNYGLSFSGLNNIKYLPITLEETYDICIFDSEATEKFKTLVKGVIKDWNLHEVLVAFLNELTFHGHPSDSKAFSESLDVSSEELQQAIERGEEVGEPIESLLITWLEADLKKAVESQNFEACERIKNKIKKHKEDLNKKEDEKE